MSGLYQAVIEWPSHVLLGLGCLIVIVLLLTYIAVKVRRLERIGSLMVTLMGPWTRERPKSRSVEKPR